MSDSCHLHCLSVVEFVAAILHILFFGRYRTQVQDRTSVFRCRDTHKHEIEIIFSVRRKLFGVHGSAARSAPLPFSHVVFLQFLVARCCGEVHTDDIQPTRAFRILFALLWIPIQMSRGLRSVLSRSHCGELLKTFTLWEVKVQSACSSWADVIISKDSHGTHLIDVALVSAHVSDVCLAQ